MAQLENSICQHWGHRPPLLLSFVSYLWFLVLVPARLQLRLRCHRNTRVRSGTGLLHSHQPSAVLPSALGVGGLTFFHRPFSVRHFGKNALPCSFKILRTKTCNTILHCIGMKRRPAPIHIALLTYLQM